MDGSIEPITVMSRTSRSILARNNTTTWRMYIWNDDDGSECVTDSTAPSRWRGAATYKAKLETDTRYKYYQPNAMDKHDKFGDCQIRALSKAMGCTWLEAFYRAISVCREEQVSLIFDAPTEVRSRMLGKLGFEWHSISNKKGTTRPTVVSFAKDHPKGTYICGVAHHEVAVVDGKYYDTWDCGECSLYGYFERVR